MFGKKKQFDLFMEDDDLEEKPAVPPVWPDALEQILLTYAPAATDREMTDTLTSAEIQTSLVNHCGQAPHKAELMSLLIERGYRYQVMNGLELHWILKRV